MAYIGQTLTEGTRREYTYVATAGQTTFNAVYTVGAVDVFQNGVLLQPSDYTATDGTTVVLGTGAALDDEITIHCHNTFSVADTVSASQGGTFNGPVSVTGTTTLTGDLQANTATFSGNIALSDVVKASFGDGSDLQIWHSGFGSYVRSYNRSLYLMTGSSPDDDIVIQGYDVATGGFGVANYLFADCGTGEVTLYNQGDPKLVTKTDGIQVNGGVYLGGAGSSNLLDDYEEGTWVPEVRGSSTAGTSSYSTREGYYIKVGNKVTVTCNVVLTSFSGASGNAIVGGLPFASRSGLGICTGTFECDNVTFSSGYTTAYVAIFGGQQYVSYRQHGSAKTEAPIPVSQVPAGNWQRFSLTYFTA